jgi:DNA-binding transcriptional ArsR family regulator
MLDAGSSAGFLPAMARKVPLSEGALELVAHRFAVLSEPMRLRLIQALFEGERSVGDLVAATGGTQGNVSRHLQTLTQAHVLTRRREGLQVFYSIADPSIFRLCELVCGSLEKSLTRQADAFGG